MLCYDYYENVFLGSLLTVPVFFFLPLFFFICITQVSKNVTLPTFSLIHTVISQSLNMLCLLPEYQHCDVQWNLFHMDFEREDVTNFPIACRRNQWLANCNRQDLKSHSEKSLYTKVLCQLHFHDSQFMNAHTYQRLIWNAVPTLFGKDVRRLEDFEPNEGAGKIQCINCIKP